LGLGDLAAPDHPCLSSACVSAVGVNGRSSCAGLAIAVVRTAARCAATLAARRVSGRRVADVRFIQEMLGHAKLTITQLYIHVSIRQLQAVHAATQPAVRATPLGAGDGH